MRTIKALRVSIVIPVYNEEQQLEACLAAVMAQTTPADEIIVVDNNSTDQTARIASRFPAVTLVSEPRQGVVFARDRGFNLASGDIIGRIDADTILPADWIATLQRLFQDPTLDGVTGKVIYHDMGLHRMVDRIDLYFRRRMARLLGPELALQGANMAIRRTVWLGIRDQVCHASGLHEDFDLAIHANLQRYRLGFDESLVASIGFRQAGYGFVPFCQYSFTSPHTYSSHGLTSGRHMYPIVAFVIIMYGPITFLSRGYDHSRNRFSWLTALKMTSVARVNPATFMD
jgi:glycosyltransferase involved in cell wall biosynthesis